MNQVSFEEFLVNFYKRHPGWASNRQKSGFVDKVAPVVNPAVPVEAKPGFVAMDGLQSAPPERPGRSEDVKPPALADRGRLQENLKNVEEVDFKLRASQGDWDGFEDVEK